MWIDVEETYSTCTITCSYWIVASHSIKIAINHHRCCQSLAVGHCQSYIGRPTVPAIRSVCRTFPLVLDKWLLPWITNWSLLLDQPWNKSKHKISQSINSLKLGRSPAGECWIPCSCRYQNWQWCTHDGAAPVLANCSPSHGSLAHWPCLHLPQQRRSSAPGGPDGRHQAPRPQHQGAMPEPCPVASRYPDGHRWSHGAWEVATRQCNGNHGKWHGRCGG